MSDFHTVCRVDDVIEGEGKTVAIGDKLIAVFRFQGQYFAIDDVCPHMGVSSAAVTWKKALSPVPGMPGVSAWRTGPGRTIPASKSVVIRCGW